MWLFKKYEGILFCRISSFHRQRVIAIMLFNESVRMRELEKGKISVIVPIYNAEKYLSHVLQDICKQTYKNMEILLVNDGSTDGSAEILQKYADQDERIKVINICNGGPSRARNIGLDNASGEFVRFIDADDRIPEDSMENMVRAYFNNNEIDLVIGNYLCEPQKNYFLGDIFSEGIVESKEFVGHFIKYIKSFYYGVPWNKLYKKEIIDTYNLRFDESIIWCEDFLFNIDYYERCKKIYYIKSTGGIYTYCLRVDSITGSLDEPEKKIDFQRIHKLRIDRAKSYCEKYGMGEMFDLEWKYACLYDELSATTKKTYSKSFVERYRKFRSILLQDGVYQYVSLKKDEADLKIWKDIKYALEKRRFGKPFMFFLFKGYMVLYFEPIMPVLRKWLQHILPKSL